MDSAGAAGLSLNDYCARKLRAPGANIAGPGAAVIDRASAQFGDALLGVIVFGSWAREETSARSDVDVLVVLERRVQIVRDLYRSWDEERPMWEGRLVEIHFVHLPAADDALSGLWAEAAIDGIVLFERGLVVSRRLAAFRRRILEGQATRRWVHGQPYWVGAP